MWIFKISLIAILFSGLNAYLYGGHTYSHFPSLNYFPSPTLYNFKIYEEPKYHSEFNFVDTSSQPDGQLHADNEKYYQINLTNGPFRLNNILLKAISGSNEYVTKYKLKASFDDKNWYDVNGGQVYQGLKNDADTAVFFFAYAVDFKHLRFIPVEYFSRISFNLVISFDDILESNLRPERGGIFINSYKLPEDQHVIPGIASVPQGYQNYKTDKFNNVFYYAGPNGIDTRSTVIEGSHVYNDAEGTSPYELLGNPLILNEILGYFFDNLLTKDPVLGGFFTEVEAANHKHLVLEFFSKMLGGKVDYTGKDMLAAHKGLAILDTEFDRFVSLIVKAFTTFNIDENIIQEVVRRLETYRKEVVNK